MKEICLAGWAQNARYPGEPLAAWQDAMRATGVDPVRVDSLDVVYCQSWQYDDPPGRLAQAMGASPRRLHYSGIGGTTPLELIAQAAERIAAGEMEVCAIVAGESLASLRTMKKASEEPDWSYAHPDPPPFPLEGVFHPSELAHGITAAYSTFAMRDVAWRAAHGLGVAEHRQYLGELYSAMTRVAAENPYAWFPKLRSPSELADVAADNRLVAFPYTKLLTSIMDVDLASAVVLATPEAAQEMGIPEHRLVWVKGWGTGRDPDYIAEQDDLARSAGMKAAFQGALSASGVSIEDVGHIDLYSCFPSAVSVALDALDLDRDHRLTPFTVTGGLPYAGGPGSGYALGSVAAMADRLSEEHGAIGMVTAVGMHLSKHAAMMLSSAPAAYGGGFESPTGLPARLISNQYAGVATVATYTVLHARDGTATHAQLVCDIDSATRCYAISTDPAFLAALEAQEWVGQQVLLRREGDRNVASPDAN